MTYAAIDAPRRDVAKVHLLLEDCVSWLSRIQVPEWCQTSARNIRELILEKRNYLVSDNHCLMIRAEVGLNGSPKICWDAKGSRKW